MLKIPNYFFDLIFSNKNVRLMRNMFKIGKSPINGRVIRKEILFKTTRKQ